ncbi:MAG: CRISPR-associated endonuclease Cas2 [Chloroflexi bacterium]|nr:CRISPR-associated endonuclease Cas2 [Chloroflexota bacterium]
MRCIVVYDIPADRPRAKVADACLDYGLSRIQYSAFLGDISRNRQEELLLKIRRLLGKADARVALFPVCDTDFRSRIEVTRP